MLPLEAIEVEAFRKRYAGDTFWCGLLLGGCGLALSSKLYLDRACHFAHHPDPTGEHVCSRRARDVSSADHLYVKAAAEAWLAARGRRARFDFRDPLGSVVDIAFDRGAGALRVHLDDAMRPDWGQPDVEPVLGVSVPVKDEVLVRRRYVHRIRFESAGTERWVRIGTEAFAADTEWFGLDECEMTGDGLRTPAVERIIRARTAQPPRTGPWRPGERWKPKPVRQPGRAARLVAAVESGSRIAVESLLREIESSEPLGPAEEALAGALQQARVWLAEQAELRAGLFGELDQAVRHGEVDQARALLQRVEAEARSDRTEAEHRSATAAADFVKAERLRARQEAKLAALEAERAKLAGRRRAGVPAVKAAATRQGRFAERKALGRMTTILSDLQRQAEYMPAHRIVKLVTAMADAAQQAGGEVTAEQHDQVDRWVARARRLQAAAPDGARVKTVLASTSVVVRSRRSPESLAQAAAAVRGALKKAAREQSTSTWSRLHSQLGSALPTLLPDDRRDVLRLVDADTPPDEPLLITLLAGEDQAALHLHRKVAELLGRSLPVGDPELRDAVGADVAAVHEAWQRRW